MTPTVTQFIHFEQKKRNPTIHTQSTNHPWNPNTIGAQNGPENIEQDYKRTREIRPGTFSFFTIPTIQQSSRNQIAYVRETGNRSQRQKQSTRIHNPQPGHTVHLSNLQPPKDYPIKPWPLADRRGYNQQLDCDRQPNHNSPRTSTIMPVAIRWIAPQSPNPVSIGAQLGQRI